MLLTFLKYNSLDKFFYTRSAESVKNYIAEQCNDSCIQPFWGIPLKSKNRYLLNFRYLTVNYFYVKVNKLQAVLVSLNTKMSPVTPASPTKNSVILVGIP
jgi:hypothetical protein